MDEEIRHVIHYFYHCNYPAATAVALIHATYGEDSMSRSCIYYWYKEFREGLKQAVLKPKPGRPLKNEKVGIIEDLLREYPYASARYIATQVGLSHITVSGILKRELHIKKDMQDGFQEN